jgi:AraC-like DNA-binding protein
MDQFALLCDMSLSTFKREFKKAYNSSPATYIRERKIEKAKALLTTTDLLIQEIGYNCGFQDLSTFSHTFQKVSGKSPSEFRMNQNNKSLA